LARKLPLKLHEIWAIRTRLQIEEQIRDLALFNLAVDSKLRASDLVRLRVSDVATSGHVCSRATILQISRSRLLRPMVKLWLIDKFGPWTSAVGTGTPESQHRAVQTEAPRKCARTCNRQQVVSTAHATCG
jgi:hypothetical protein